MTLLLDELRHEEILSPLPSDPPSPRSGTIWPGSLEKLPPPAARQPYEDDNRSAERISTLDTRSSPCPPRYVRYYPRLRQEPRQGLRARVLRADSRLRIGERGRGLVALGGQQQPRQVAPEALALATLGEGVVELGRVRFQRRGRGG